MLNAAPGLNASVRRTTSPITRRGTCRSRRLTARTFVARSRQITAAAVVQNTRPLLPAPDGLMSLDLGKLAGLAGDRRRRRHGRPIGCRVFAPQPPCEKERTQADRHVRDVER